MENSRWKLNKERGEHLLVVGFSLVILGCALDALDDLIGLAVSTSGLWVLFWCLQSGKWITPPKWVLRLFLAVNVFLSISSIIIPIGRIFWEW